MWCGRTGLSGENCVFSERGPYRLVTYGAPPLPVKVDDAREASSRPVVVGVEAGEDECLCTVCTEGCVFASFPEKFWKSG